MDDTYKTITQTSEGLYKEKMSKFLASPCHAVLRRKRSIS